MKLLELDLRRLSGIDARFVLGAEHLGSRVTVIHGPNATGKSSLCRAVRALVWSDLESSREHDLAARFEHEGRELRVERVADHVAWSADGAPISRPDVPPTHLAACYTIDGDDLVARADDGSVAARDAALAAEIARQMSGGFDLRALAKGKDGARAGLHEARELRSAREALQKTHDEHRALDHERAELAPLAEKIERARAAQARTPAIQCAIDLCVTRERIRELESTLATYPAGMELLRGDERDRLEVIARKIADARAALALCDLDIERSTAALAAVGLPHEGLDAGRLEELRRQVLRIEQMDLVLAELDRDHAAALMALEGRRHALHPVSVPRTDVQALMHTEAFLRRSEVLGHKRAELDAKLADLPLEAPAGDRDALHTGADILARWLATADPGSKGSEISRWITLMLVVLAAVVLALEVHIAWIAIAVVAVLVEVVLRARGGRPEDSRRQYADEYARLGLSLPAQWTRDDVQARADDLARERTAHELATQLFARRCDLEHARRTLDAEAAELDRARAALGNSLGVDLSGSDLALTVVARNVVEFETARSQAFERAARLEHERGMQIARASDLATAVGALGAPSRTDAASLAGAVESLVQRAEAHVRERHGLESATGRHERAERELTDLELDRALLIASAGDELELGRRLDRLSDWKGHRADLDHARARELELTVKLAHEPDLARASRAECDAELERAERLAQEQADLIRRAQDIETRVAAVSRQHGLEESMARVDSAKEALRERRDAALDDAATSWLIERIEAESRATAQSPVFKRAAEWFAKFTHHAFALELAPGVAGSVPEFCARDTSANRRRALSELSSGTRAQLLLAARIAFAAEVERGVRLPLFLDEALAKSDPDRFASVASSLALFAREDDRQIVYLTSDPAEIALWQRAVPPEELTVVDLARVRGVQSSAAERSLARPSISEIPSPAGRTPAEYARDLLVPAIDPHASTEALHLYYLLDDDLDLLHALLGIRVDTLGKLRSLARSRDWRAYLAPERMQRVEATAAVFEATVLAWRVGRGVPVKRDVLEAAGVSDKFLDGLSAIAAEVSGDAKRMLEVIVARTDPRIRGWHKSKTSELEDHLVQHGHLDPCDPLTDHDVLMRALEAGATGVQRGSMEALDVPRRVSWWLAHFRADDARRADVEAASASTSASADTSTRASDVTEARRT